ncbi:MAG: hypothetical protein JWM16_4555 [Verrucomicrobiales bacterium]|nr:hypothetical protein [Verrucomicrobiales bacterium]
MSKAPTYILKDKLSNIIIGRDLLQQLLDRGKKVESWRLGYETSEDALSWNVFAGLLNLHGLNEVLRLFAGLELPDEPELFLWGRCVNRGCVPSTGLQMVRQELEAGLGIPTEPDIKLRVPGKVLVLIEAKFGSANGILKGKKKRFGGGGEFLQRYRSKRNCPDPLNRDWILQQPPEKVMEQLCRNVIFAQWLAEEGEQVFVVNLVRRCAHDDNISATQVPDVRYEMILSRRIYDIQTGDLPRILVSNVILATGEVAHCSEPGSLYEESMVSSHFEGGSSGVSFRVMKGVSFRVGAHRGSMVSEKADQAVSSGSLVITSARVIFQGDAKSFATKLSKIIDIARFRMGSGFQKPAGKSQGSSPLTTTMGNT